MDMSILFSKNKNTREKKGSKKKVTITCYIREKKKKKQIILHPIHAAGPPKCAMVSCNVLPLVSGTKRTQKRKLTAHSPPNNQ